MRIAIAGTPGTGKSTVAKKLAERLGYPLLRANDILKQYRISYDRIRESWIVDVEKAAKRIKLPEDCVLEGHLSYFFPVDLVIVLRISPKILFERLKARGWKKGKIRENVEAEALNIIGEEARWMKKNVFEVDTTGKSPEEVVKEIEDIIAGKGERKEFDFLEELDDIIDELI